MDGEKISILEALHRFDVAVAEAVAEFRAAIMGDDDGDDFDRDDYAGEFVATREAIDAAQQEAGE